MNSYIRSSLWLWVGLVACQAQETTERSRWEAADANDAAADPQELDAIPQQGLDAEEIPSAEAGEVTAPLPVSGVFLKASIEGETGDSLIIGLQAYQGEQRTRELAEPPVLSWQLQPSSVDLPEASLEESKDPNFDAYLFIRGAPLAELKAKLPAYQLQLQVQTASLEKEPSRYEFNLGELLQP